MKKSAYSLILSDGVVAAIDKLAYKNHTNRSGMVNRILAEYVSYITPEQRFQKIFQEIGEAVRTLENFQLMLPTSDTLLSMRSALVYKYNPSVKYSVELYRGDEQYLGELRVGMRTQNADLSDCLQDFFLCWQKAEHLYTGKSASMVSGGRFLRKLLLPSSEEDSAALGERIADYIRGIDTALKAYFQALGTAENPENEVFRVYRSYHAATGSPV